MDSESWTIEHTNRLLDDLIHRADRLDERLLDDKHERQEENKKRDKRIRWSRITIVFTVIVAVLALLVGYNARVTADDILKARRDNQQAVCQAFESFTNSLIGLQHPTNAESLAKANATLAAFSSDLKSRLAPLNCHLTLITLPG